MSTENTGRELGWDDTIQEDAGEFIILPEGDYDFIVDDFERARHNGSEKLPACNKAILKLRIEVPEGTVIITHNIFLHQSVERMISAFFSSIGLKKKGEKVRMDWNRVTGARGRLKLGTRIYDGKTYNEVKRFYPKEEAAPAFTPGKF